MEYGKMNNRIPPIRAKVPIDGRNCGNCEKSYSLCASKIVGHNCSGWYPKGVLNILDDATESGVNGNIRVIQSLPEQVPQPVGVGLEGVLGVFDEREQKFSRKTFLRRIIGR